MTRGELWMRVVHCKDTSLMTAGNIVMSLRYGCSTHASLQYALARWKLSCSAVKEGQLLVPLGDLPVDSVYVVEVCLTL